MVSLGRGNRPVWRTLALGGLAGFVLLTAVCHGLDPALLPNTATVSEYVLGPAGLVMTLAFVSLVLGSGSLLAATARAEPWPVGRICLWVWTVGVAVLTVFPTGPMGRPDSPAAVVHGVAATLAIFALLVAQLVAVFGRVGRRPELRRLSAAALLVFGLTVALGTAGLFGFGLIERGILLAHMLWLAGLALVWGRH